MHVRVPRRSRSVAGHRNCPGGAERRQALANLLDEALRDVPQSLITASVVGRPDSCESERRQGYGQYTGTS